jgi:ABC-type transporter Mla MlaB component
MPADVVGLCTRVRVRLESSDDEVLVCDVGAVTEPDVGAIDALACLQLTARRLGREVRLRNPSRELLGLLDLCGLSDVLAGVEPRGQAEEREQARRVEEGVERGDPAV